MAKKKANKQLIYVVMAALFAAMITVFTAYVLHIPAGNGYIHLGDSFIFGQLQRSAQLLSCRTFLYDSLACPILDNLNAILLSASNVLKSEKVAGCSRALRLRPIGLSSRYATFRFP